MSLEGSTNQSNEPEIVSVIAEADQGRVSSLVIGLVVGVSLILLALVSVAQGVYFTHKDNATTACIQRNFSTYAQVSVIRANLVAKEAALSKRDTAASRSLWLIYADAAGLLKDNPTGQLKPAEQRKLQIKLVHALLRYRVETTDIQQQRDQLAEERLKHPIPNFPPGKCE